jgi:predicted  nucleic acid-binding Zn-ribbon protein
MDIKKYIKNKDIEITNDDFNIEKLESDLRKGYVESSEVDERVKSAVEEVQKASKTEYETLKRDYDSLQNNYTEIEKRNTDLADKVKTVSLERTMVEYGFNKDQFDEVSKLRSSLYSEEADDDKAISQIKEKYKNTYFPTVEPTKQKDDTPINNGVVQPQEIKVSRLTSIKDILKK